MAPPAIKTDHGSIGCRFIGMQIKRTQSENRRSLQLIVALNGTTTQINDPHDRKHRFDNSNSTHTHTIASAKENYNTHAHIERKHQHRFSVVRAICQCCWFVVDCVLAIIVFQFVLAHICGDTGNNEKTYTKFYTEKTIHTQRVRQTIAARNQRKT